MLLDIPRVDLVKGLVRDEALRKLIRHRSALSGLKQRYSRELNLRGHSRLFEVALSEAELGLLEDVLRHRNDGVDARYRRLGVTAYTGNLAKSNLVRLGWLDEELLAIGKTRRNLLRPSSEARRRLGVLPKTKIQGSIAHDYWQRFYGELYGSRGYKVTLEAPRGKGRVDVLAEKQGKRIGIEIETGKSDVVSNVRNCLLSRFDEVIVVTTSRKARKRVQRSLLESSLLIPGRVTLESCNYREGRERGTLAEAR
ncbi:MAG: hypothetical protein A49_11860 [Methyloceanibacter sp.]|nr:MAG: hypothetical protein A49_11860 [Methyloceanibacter sp.]